MSLWLVQPKPGFVALGSLGRVFFTDLRGGKHHNTMTGILPSYSMVIPYRVVLHTTTLAVATN